jgi:hypothetical protein
MHDTWRRACLIGLLLTATAMLPSSSAACSMGPHCRELRGVQPVDGATNVPRNVELRVWYDGANYLEAGAEAVLERDDGQVVSTSWERVQQGAYRTMQLWIGRPAAPLAASTHYRLRHSYKACSEVDGGVSQPGSCSGLCMAAVGDVISEFTTGASTEERTLAAPTLGAVTPSGVDVCTNSACCGPYERCMYSITLPALPRDHTVRVARGGALVGDFAGSVLIGTSIASAGASRYWQLADLVGAGDYQVQVVDAIGNRSPATTLTLPSCVITPDGGLPHDGGTEAVGDSGVPRADAAVQAPLDAGAGAHDAAAMGPTAPAPDDRGCAIPASRTGWTSLVLVALSMLLARRRARTR